MYDKTLENFHNICHIQLYFAGFIMNHTWVDKHLCIKEIHTSNMFIKFVE